MTEAALWLDTLLGSEEATEVRTAIAATAVLGVKGLSVAPSALLKSAINDTVAGALHVDLLAVFAEGWTLARDIKAYGDPKLHPKGTTAVLKLGKHDIERDIRPVISIDLGGPQRFPVDLAIGLTGTFRGIEITIRDAAIVAVGSGSCDISVKLVLAKQQLWTRTLAEVRLPGAHTFATPIAIPLV